MTAKTHALVLLAMAAAAGPAALASGINGQQIIVTFSGVALVGSIANDPAAGANTILDNTSTAVFNITNDVVNNNVASSSMSWGIFTGTNTGFQPFSDLVFVGNTIPTTHATSAFNVGSLTFLNGTSDLTSLVFGVTMNFYAGSINQTNYLGSDTVAITTTSNVFGVPGGLTSGDDDYVNVCGQFSGICGTSIEAVESSEGGTGFVVNLSGTIVGDPMLTISGVTVAGTQDPNTNGFLGSDPAIGSAAPEPSSWALTACAAAFVLFLARRRRLAPQD